MQFNHSWLNKRKVFFIYFSIEVIIFILIKKIFSTNFNVNNIIYLLIWILFSYIFGRYHNHSSSIRKNLLRKFFNILTTIVYTNLLYYLILIVEIFFYKKNFFNIEFLIYTLFFGLTSYIVFSIIQNVFLKSLKIQRKWLFIGSKEEFNSLMEFSKKNKKNIIIYRTTKILNKKNYINRYYDGLIISDKIFIKKEEKDFLIELKTKGLIIINQITWMEFELQILPTDFLKFDNVLNESLNFNMKSIDFRLKRSIDISMSLLLIILTSPIVLFFGLLIYAEDKGPIFYSQLRKGFRGKEFKIWKLRSMYLNSEPNGAVWSKTDDKRITKIGRFIRSTGIDEIPQFMNILKGEMSFIGPRPERPEIDEKLILHIPFYKLRYLHKPGLSGWAQVCYPYASSISDTKTKLSYDLYYIKNFSMALDILIYLKTIRVIFNRRNSNANLF